MKGLFRALSIVPYEHLDSTLVELRALEKNWRDQLRKEFADQVKELNPLQDGITIKELSDKLQSNIDRSHHVETTLLEFVNKLK